MSLRGGAFLEITANAANASEGPLWPYGHQGGKIPAGGWAVSDAEVERVLAAAGPPVRALAERARVLVRAVLPADVVETVDGTDIGYGWTSGYRGLICVIGVHARWLNLGLADGAGLPDPEGLLRGSGKRHRFVRIAVPEDLERPGLRELLQAATDAHPRPR